MSNVNITTQSVADDSAPPRRRSARLSSPSQTAVTRVLSENNKEKQIQTPSGESLQKKAKTSPLGPAQAPPAAAKRSIAVRKIVPRKTNVLPEDNNKENAPKRPSGGSLRKSPRTSTAAAAGPAKVPLPQAAALSPVPAPLNTGVPAPPQDPPQGPPQDPVWSQKVRRSYSRLSPGDRSFESPPPPQALSSPALPHRRDSLFGFEKLQTPEVAVARRAGRSDGASGAGGEASRSLCGLSSFTLLLDADRSGAASPPELDVNIPGVALVKEKRRRKRVPQMDVAELDVLAAQMNAEFEEAEGFDLVVE